MLKVKCSQCSCTNIINNDHNIDQQSHKCAGCGHDLPVEQKIQQSRRVISMTTKSTRSIKTLSLQRETPSLLERSCLFLHPDVDPSILFNVNLHTLLAFRLVSHGFNYLIHQINSTYPYGPLFAKAFISLNYVDIKSNKLAETKLEKVTQISAEKYQFAISNKGIGINIFTSFNEFINEISDLANKLNCCSKQWNNCPDITLEIKNSEELNQFHIFSNRTNLDDNERLILSKTRIYSKIDDDKINMQLVKALLPFFIFVVFYLALIIGLYLSGFKANRYAFSRTRGF